MRTYTPEALPGERNFSWSHTLPSPETIRSVLSGNPWVPIKLEEIINKALEKDREVRYHSARDLRADLKRLKRDTDSGGATARQGTLSPVARLVQRQGRSRTWRCALAGLAAAAAIAIGIAVVRWKFFPQTSETPPDSIGSQVIP